jgi:hypothetical protein
VPYDRDDIRDAVRALAPNITPAILSDDRLSVYARNALRRLNVDHPYEKSVRVTGNGAKFRDLSVILTDWVDERSRVFSVISPSPVIADDGLITHLDPNIGFEQYREGGNDYIRFTSAPSSSDASTIRYTVPWTVLNVNSATATTLLDRFENAVEYLTTALTCYALATESAGTTSSFMPGDVVNYRSKQSEYERAGRVWERMYQQELGIGRVAKPAGAAVARAPEMTDQRGLGRLTHGRR